jgi:hypothetical protein
VYRYLLISILLILLLNIKYVYSTDEIQVDYTGHFYDNTSGITKNYNGPINNPWMYDHNIGIRIFDNSSSDTTTFNNNNFLNTSASFTGNIGGSIYGRSGTGGFLNISSWNGYLWSFTPNLNSNVLNNSNISTTLNVNNVIVDDNGGMNFFNHSIYFPYVVNPNFSNNGNINNVCNVSNSSRIVSIYNYAVSASDTGSVPGGSRPQTGNVIFSNLGLINNSLNITNTNFTGGLYNYVFNSYNPNKSFSVNYLNNGNLTNNIVLQNVSAVEIRNQVLLSIGSSSNIINSVNITNNSNITANMTLINTNTGSNNRISNDGIAFLYADYSNVNNNGNIIVNTYFDNSSGLEGSHGIIYSYVNQGSIFNNGLIRIRNNVANGLNSGGITLVNSGIVNPIVINTPVLMDLDSNVRNIILINSSARLDSFGWYVDGDPSTLLRPILIDNNSNLNLNNTNLHLWIGSNIYLNTPYYIVQNIGSNITGSFNNTIIQNFTLNPDIQLSWFNNTNDPGIIFRMNRNLNPTDNFYLISNTNNYFIYKNYNDYLRNYLINNYNIESEKFNFNEEIENKRFILRQFSYYEYFNSKNIDGEVLARSLVLDRYLNNKSKIGFIIGNISFSQKQELNIYKTKDRGLSYGIYSILENKNNYLFFNYLRNNIEVKYYGLTGVNLSIFENSKYNVNIDSGKIEYGIKKNDKNFLIGINYNNIADINYITQSENVLFNRNVSIDSKNLLESYIGLDTKDFKNSNKDEFYYLTFRIGYLLSDNKINIYERLQNDNRILTYEIPRFSFKTGFYFNLKDFLLSFNAEFNKDYQNYGVKVSKRF